MIEVAKATTEHEETKFRQTAGVEEFLVLEGSDSIAADELDVKKYSLERIDKVANVRVGMGLLIAADIALAVITGFLAFELNPWPVDNTNHISLIWFCVSYAICLPIFAQIFGMHDQRQIPEFWELTGKACAITMFSIFAVHLLVQMIFYNQVGRYITLFTFVLSVGLFVVCRLLIGFVFSYSDKTKIAFVGSSKFRQRLSAFIENSAPGLFQIMPFNGRRESLLEMAKKNKVDELVVDLADSDLSDSALIDCINSGFKV